MMRKVMVAAATAALIAAPAWAYKMVTHGTVVAVARSPMTVQPAIDWNRQQSRPGRNAESWTLDGIALNEVTFYGGIGDGETLFKEVDKKDKPLPKFSASMLAPDIGQLFEQSYRLAGGSSLFSIDGFAPTRFAGEPGFRFTYSFTLQNDEVRRRGEASGAVIGGKLYMIAYEAPAVHYFDHNLDDVRALVGTVKIPGPSVKVG